MAHEQFSDYFFPLVRALCGVEGGAERHAAGQALVDRGFMLGVCTADRFFLRTDAMTRRDLQLDAADVLVATGGETFEAYRAVPMAIIDQPIELRRWLNEARNVAGRERDRQ